MFTTELVTNLQDIKAKGDDANRPLDSNVLLMLPIQLIKVYTGMSIQEVLDPFHVHITKFWLVEKIKIIEDKHRDLLKVYNSYLILKTIIDNQDHQTSFNHRWDILDWPANSIPYVHLLVVQPP